jgi:hypothetical protein
MDKPPPDDHAGFPSEMEAPAGPGFHRLTERRWTDISQAQDAINRQIPFGYDISIGVIWTGAGRERRIVRAGTKAKTAAMRGLVVEFEARASPGLRLAAIAILQTFPDPRHLDWLARAEQSDRDAVRRVKSHGGFLTLASCILKGSILSWRHLAEREDQRARVLRSTPRVNQCRSGEDG